MITVSAAGIGRTPGSRSHVSRVFLLFMLSLLIPCPVSAGPDPPGDWRVFAGAGLIVAPAFVGARTYSLLALPDLRVTWRDRLSANMKDGISYAVITQDGWRIGPVVSYTFTRSERSGGSIFRIAGGDRNALQGMGDVPGTLSLGGFVEYSAQPYKLQFHLHKGVNGHEGLVTEARAGYGGVLSWGGPPLIYSVGPHVKCGDSAYTNAYWGISPERSARSGLEQYHAAAGIVSYGVSLFTMMPLSRDVSLTALAGYDRLGPPVADSPLVRVRGSDSQAMGGVFVGYRF